METKYKILLAIYAFFACLFTFIVPWDVPPERGYGSHATNYAFILASPAPRSGIIVSEMVFNIVIVTIIFAIAYWVVKKYF